MLTAKGAQTSVLWVNPRFATRVPELDGIRGIAIFLILCCHILSTFVEAAPEPLSSGLQMALRLSWSGVDLFFVLSGFLIGGILMDAKGSPHFFRTFYMRRIYRIQPLYLIWFSLFVAGLLFADKARYGHIFNQDLPAWSYAVFVQNFFSSARETFGAQWIAVSWSLAIEEQFYLILPLLIWFLPRPTMAKVVAAIALAAPLVRIALFASGNLYYASLMLLPARFDALGLGVLAAVLVRNRTAWEWLRNHMGRLTAISTILFLGCLVLHLRPRGRLMISVGYTWLALFYVAVLLLALVPEDNLLKRFFRMQFLRSLGLIAYAVYLLHQGVLYTFHATLYGREPRVDSLGSFALTSVSLLLTFALARASWIWMEQPLIRKAHEQFRY
jgi:peptidoglycan/LPS O-acetylase OafA/YrhL